ncbi:MAG: septal ring lytic transglycosylase RlpA family protein [Flavobacteriales bacterium]
MNTVIKAHPVEKKTAYTAPIIIVILSLKPILISLFFMLSFIIVLLLSSVSAKAQFAAPDTGIASFYSNAFHLRRTASGDIYHKDSLTAAHKHLPFGTLVRVTNLSNQKSVIVKINDRGMKGKNRIIDLSQAAARELSMISKGLAKVMIEIIHELPMDANTE